MNPRVMIGAPFREYPGTHQPSAPPHLVHCWEPTVFLPQSIHVLMHLEEECPHASSPVSEVTLIFLTEIPSCCHLQTVLCPIQMMETRVLVRAPQCGDVFL